MMDLKSRGPRFKFLACHSSVFALSSTKFNSSSSAVLCKHPASLPSASYHVLFVLFVGIVVEMRWPSG